MRNLVRYNQQRKQKFLRMLDELSKRVRNGQLAVSEYGFWDSRTNNTVHFKISVLSRDSEKEIRKFEEFS